MAASIEDDLFDAGLENALVVGTGKPVEHLDRVGIDRKRTDIIEDASAARHRSGHAWGQHASRALS